MMTDSDFRDLVRVQLIDTYGEKAFPPNYFMKLKQMSCELEAAELRKIFEKVTMESLRAPPLSLFARHCLEPNNKARAERQRREAQEKIAAGGQACIYCGGGGWVTAYPPAYPHADFSFICGKCPAASLLKMRGPVWHDGLLETYHLVKALPADLKRHMVAKDALTEQLVAKERSSAAFIAAVPGRNAYSEAKAQGTVTPQLEALELQRRRMQVGLSVVPAAVDEVPRGTPDNRMADELMVPVASDVPWHEDRFGLDEWPPEPPL